MKMLAAIVGIAVILSPPLHAQFTGPRVADAKPGDVRVIATAAIREPLNAVLKQAEATIDAAQVAIASILTDMDAEIAALEAKLAKARQVKQGMMQELLIGRIRLV